MFAGVAVLGVNEEGLAQVEALLQSIVQFFFFFEGLYFQENFI